MIEPDPVIGPGVGVGIEMDQGQRAVFLGMSSEQRIRDEVVTAEGHHRGPASQDLVGVGLDAFDGLQWMAIVEVAIAVVGDGQYLERVESEGV